MRGDFKTDITRDTFRWQRHFSRVLMQQGRVQIDADWNEQVDILLYHMRTFITDVIGPYGGPDDSFLVSQYSALSKAMKDGRTRQKAAPTQEPVPYYFTIEKGHYYVSGILCENDEAYIYSIPQSERLESQPNQCYLLYLDVWEREVTYLEDGYIREVALGGPDTATRSEIVWRIRSALLQSNGMPGDPTQCTDDEARTLFRNIVAQNHGWLKAKVVEPREQDKNPCTVSPMSQYRGPENQLYRVEIHEGSGASNGPTFKWSCENGSVLFAILGEVVGGQNLTKLTLTLHNLGRDDGHYGLQVDDWVEIVDRQDELDNIPGPLFRVDGIDYASRQVTLLAYSSEGATINVAGGPMKTPFLRRWDYRDIDPSQRHEPQLAESGALLLIENHWLVLENGIQILFYRDEQSTEKPIYRTGDYWLIPARVATGNIEWPYHDNEPEALPPHGVEHYYAPLALAILQDGIAKGDGNPHDLRTKIKSPLA